MSETTILTIIQVLGGGFFGFLIAKYSLNKQLLSKDIIYTKEVLSLLSLHEEDTNQIRVSVKKSILTGDINDSTEDIEIKNAHAHAIKIKNKGNIEATDLFFDIGFDKEIKIISYSIFPEPSNSYPITISKNISKQNILNISIPYLNKNQTIIVSIITTGSDEEPESTIIGNGKGIEVREFEKSETFFILFFVSFVLSMFLIQILFDSYFIEEDRFSSYLPEYIINFIGGKIISVSIPIIEFPLYIKIIALASSFSLVIYSIYQSIKRSKF
ncbi:MAG: hypothetical protein PHU40_06595 [Sulfurimonas sp.]|nr:hypothetical protein [Sulfurimonas sp.]